MRELLTQMQEDLGYLLNLEDDWDDEGANAPKLESVNKAFLFLHLMISKGITEPYGLNISPLRDGNIDISWEKDDGNLSVFFSERGISCFGKCGESVINGWSVDLEEVSIQIFNWMINNKISTNHEHLDRL